MIGEDDMDLILCGSYSEEEIIKITFTLKEIEKVSAYFSSKTDLHLYVGQELYEAAAQTVAMAGISSFSFIDPEVRRIRVCIEPMEGEKKAKLTEYFQRSAIYFKVCSRPLQDRIFFTPVQRQAVQKYDSYDSEELDDYVNTIKTFKYLDRDTFACAVCDYYSDKWDSVTRHAHEFHIKPKRRMSDHDIVIDYIEIEDDEEDS